MLTSVSVERPAPVLLYGFFIFCEKFPVLHGINSDAKACNELLREIPRLVKKKKTNPTESYVSRKVHVWDYSLLFTFWTFVETYFNYRKKKSIFQIQFKYLNFNRLLNVDKGDLVRVEIIFKTLSVLLWRLWAFFYDDSSNGNYK